MFLKTNEKNKNEEDDTKEREKVEMKKDGRDNKTKREAI